MAKRKKNNTTALIVNGLVILMAAGVVISFFMYYYTTTVAGHLLSSGTTTGWDIYNAKGDSDIKAYITISLILSVVLAAVAVLRMIKFPMFRSTLFSIAYIGVAVAMIVFAVLTMVGLNDSSWSFGSSNGGLGIGVILNLIFSIVATLGTVGAFYLQKK